MQTWELTFLMLGLHLNFKTIFYFFLLTTIFSCGVKGPPVQHTETIVDSYVREYTNSEMDAEEIERLKNQKTIPSTIELQQKKEPSPVKP